MDSQIDNTCICLWETELLYCADVVAHCTHNLTRNLFVCGTYQLQESEDDTKSTSTNKRLGCLYLYQIAEDGKECKLLQTVALPGVLDAKWMHLNDVPFLVVALADGQIRFFKLRDSQLSEEAAIDASYENGISLTLDCSDRECRVLTSDSKGHVNLFNVSAINSLVTNQWKAHDHEVWAIALSRHDQNVIFSGGDDCMFKVWDIRNHQQPQTTNRRHTMGVTCITTCEKRPNHLLTGSYDERIRLWDTRVLKTPFEECETGGGIWRLKWDSTEDHLLASCMHNGFHIYDEKLLLKTSYMKHKSLAYGADWVYSVGRSKTVVTCSFYDRSLQMWSATI